MINITKHEQEIILDIIKRYVPACEVRAFGSRVNGKVKAYSDLDLAVVGDSKLDNNTLFDMKELFQESELTFRIDLLDWHAISPEFRKVIEANYEVLFPQNNKKS
jgi:predicted nucleotidyltransferase